METAPVLSSVDFNTAPGAPPEARGGPSEHGENGEEPEEDRRAAACASSVLFAAAAAAAVTAALASKAADAASCCSALAVAYAACGKANTGRAVLYAQRAHLFFAPASTPDRSKPGKHFETEVRTRVHRARRIMRARWIRVRSKGGRASCAAVGAACSTIWCAGSVLGSAGAGGGRERCGAAHLSQSRCCCSAHAQPSRTKHQPSSQFVCAFSSAPIELSLHTQPWSVVAGAFASAAASASSAAVACGSASLWTETQPLDLLPCSTGRS